MSTPDAKKQTAARTGFAKQRTLIIVVLAALVILAEIRGAFDLRRLPYGGFWNDRNHTITRVIPRGPAQEAGFKLGDRILSNGGIDANDSRGLARRHPWATIGETRAYVVDRNGEIVSLHLTFGGLPPREIALSIARATIGFSFLILGLWAYLKIRDKSTTLFALVGVCVGLALVNEPYIVSYTLSRVFFSIQGVMLVLGFAFLLHFMIVFPREKPVLEKRHMMIMLYGPAVLVGLYGLCVHILELERSSVLGSVTAALGAVYVLGYLGLAAVALVHSYVKATPGERVVHGWKVVLVGTIAGLAPIATVVIMWLIAPRLVLPGVDFYALSMVLIPVSLALAMAKRKAPQQ
jgi:hypothetical protein